MTDYVSAFSRRSTMAPASKLGAPGATPRITWVGPMEVMMEGCRYRLVATGGTVTNETDATGATNGQPSFGEHEAILPLTPRETQIARLVARGYVNKEIAIKLAISESTVATHMRRMFAKLDVDTRAAMVLRCFGRGAAAHVNSLAGL